MDNSCDESPKLRLRTPRAKKLVRKVIKFKKSNRTGIPQTFNVYRVFLGLSCYPDKSNIISNVGFYGFSNEVAFFSTKSKPDLFFVLATLLGNNEAACDLIDYINSKQQTAPVSWNDIVEYLAMVKGIYFTNIHDKNFKTFQNALANVGTVKYLVFSSTLDTQKMVNEFLRDNDSAAFIIHPSAKNLNKYPPFWFRQYVLNKFAGPIDLSNNGGLTYKNFQI